MHSGGLETTASTTLYSTGDAGRAVRKSRGIPQLWRLPCEHGLDYRVRQQHQQQQLPSTIYYTNARNLTTITAAQVPSDS